MSLVDSPADLEPLLHEHADLLALVAEDALEQGFGRALLRGPALAARRRLEPMFFLTVFSNFDV